jgi:hypothetical protein
MATYESRRYNTPVADVTKVADGSVDNTEFQYINSLSSNAQTQIAARLPLAGGTMTGGIKLGDNVKAQFGDTSSPDLEIYHSGTDSVIKDAGTGPLKILTHSLSIKNVGDTEEMISATENGAVNLFYDNANKLQTTGTGVTVSGVMAATTLTGDGSALTALNASNLATGTVPAARLPGGLGKVLQVVSTNNGTVFSTSSSSYVDVSGQAVTITPSATSSKVLVTLDYTTDTFGDNTVYSVQLVRGSTAIGNAADGNQMLHMNANEYDTGGFTFLDSPSTTSATTYKLQVKTGSHSGPGGGTIIFNRSQDAGQNNLWKSNITVQEIGT